ncbi:hypothetical protein K490DRAFT_64586 [Saccharata proteae CBS 121410]|uniref:Uncharacterized protein n=1 Tax=Saccharata proteae CBS 121410 TaxID=1314787 RepID=A0A9P4HXB4_9PEZI|nr:hypothetical protein K490DRAFT_64586 [Saccharata proteae CBS 121410]
MALGMSSFEALLSQRDQGPADIIRSLLKPVELLQLRATSTITQNWVEEDADFFYQGFRNLGVQNTKNDFVDKSLTALVYVGGNCHDLSVKIHGGITPVFLETWTSIFTSIRRLEILTISTNGSSNWATTDTVPTTLTLLRSAIEDSNPRYLTSLRLLPINPPDILSLRSLGTALGNSTWTTRPFWESITSLEIQMVNPLHYYSKKNRRDFYCNLHNFLAGFRFTLKTLKWHWVDALGPNPLLLDEKCRKKDWKLGPLIWAQLDQLWLAHVQVWPEHFRQMAWRAQKLVDAYILYDGLDGDEDGFVSFVPGKQWRIMELGLEDYAIRKRWGGMQEERLVLPSCFGQVCAGMPPPDLGSPDDDELVVAQLLEQVRRAKEVLEAQKKEALEARRLSGETSFSAFIRQG